METGGSLAVPATVRELQQALPAQAKRDPNFRFYTLSDKVGRPDVLEAAWQAVRRNGGACGVDGETVADVEARGVCCFAHSYVASGSHWAGGRLLPERNDPGQASLRIDARSAS